VLGQPDTPALSAREMQLAVEALAREVIIPIMNENTALQEALNAQILRKDNTETFIPTGDYQPATKKMVDDAVIGAGGVTAEMLAAVDSRASAAQEQAAQKADPPTALAVVLTSAAWGGDLAQTLLIPAVGAASAVVVTPAAENLEIWGQCGVRCSAQAAGQLSFSCTDLPAEDIAVNLLIFAEVAE